ncbi:hypothetical protein ACERNI_10780 [Camelimonas sp. ID_303_24]
MAEAVVKLIKPLTGHKGPITELRFREPVFGDLRRHGEPFAQAFGRDGMVMRSIDHQVVSGYARDLVDDVDPLLLDRCSIQDSIAISDVIIGFFLPPAAEPASSSEPTNSFSPSDGTPPLSIG